MFASFISPFSAEVAANVTLPVGVDVVPRITFPVKTFDVLSRVIVFEEAAVIVVVLLTEICG